MTHRDGLPRFSARSVRPRSALCDAGHREPCATPSESLGKPPVRSPMRPVGGRRKALTMSRHRLRPASYPTGRLGDPYGSLSPFLGISRLTSDNAADVLALAGHYLASADGDLSDEHLPQTLRGKLTVRAPPLRPHPARGGA